MDTSTQTIMDQINEMLEMGLTLDEILVNDGTSEWGENCAVTTACAAAFREDWANNGQDVSDLPELTPAAKWIASHQADVLTWACERAHGLHYASPEAKALLHADHIDWAEWYPIVDPAGLLTGKAHCCTDISRVGEFANVDDEAVVAIADLPKTEQDRIRADIRNGEWDGYTSLPEPPELHHYTIMDRDGGDEIEVTDQDLESAIFRAHEWVYEYPRLDPDNYGAGDVVRIAIVDDAGLQVWTGEIEIDCEAAE